MGEFRGGVWSLVRQKRGTAGAIQLHPLAVRWLERALADRRPIEDTPNLIVDEVTQAPPSPRLFAARFLAIRRAAEAEAPTLCDIIFRDTRRTFGVYARMGGALRADIGDVLGNTLGTSPELARVYTPAEGETAARAVAAVAIPPELMEI